MPPRASDAMPNYDVVKKLKYVKFSTNISKASCSARQPVTVLIISIISIQRVIDDKCTSYPFHMTAPT